MDRRPKEQHHFPFKLYDMLEFVADSGYSSLVSWVDEGRGFAIHNKDEFLKQIVPRFFNQTKFRSFTRQLNLWGFTRLTTISGDAAWKHEHFVRGRVERLSDIKRMEVQNRRNKTMIQLPKKSKPAQHHATSITQKSECTVSGVMPQVELNRLIPALEETTVLPFLNETEYAPPIFNIPSKTLDQPLMPNRKFQSQTQHQTKWPCVLAPPLHLTLPSNCSAPTNSRDHFVSSSMDISQIQLPYSREHNTAVQHHHAMQPPAMIDRTDQDDILFLVSGIVKSVENFNGDDSPTTLPPLDEVSEDFLNPLSF